MTPSPNPNPSSVRGAVSPALRAGGGASLAAPAKSLEELAHEVVYKTPSEFDSIIVVTSSGIQYASKGQYGGWIVRGQLAESEVVAALWCYKREWSSVNDARSVEDPNIKRFLNELAKHGFEFDYAAPYTPSARFVKYKYRPVEVKVTKAADRYTVIDITPVGEDDAVEAKATHVYWSYHISRRGRCSGFCSETSREKVMLVAKMLGLEAYREEAGGSRDYEVRVKIVSDYAQVAGYLRSKLAPEPATVTPATAEAGLPPLPELPKETEEVVVEGGEAALVAQATTPPGYVKVKVLDFDLPTEYLGGRTTTVLEEVEDGEAKMSVTVEKKEVRIPQLRSLRRKFYKVLERLAFKASGLWVLMHDVTEDELRELNDVMAEINGVLARHGLPARAINIIEAYLPEQWVKVKLAEYIEHAMSEIEAKKAVEKKTRDVMREIQRLEELLKRLMREQKFYGSVTLQGVA